MPNLPPQFASLEVYSGWASKTETERNGYRLCSTQESIVEFASAILSKASEIVSYLDKLSDEEKATSENENLLCLLLSLAEVAPAIEAYNNPTVVDGFDSRRFRAQEQFKLRPRI
jgi:hypothetical protein